MKVFLDDLLAFLQSVKGGLADKIRPQEELFITISQAPQVLCCRCGGTVCYVKDASRPVVLENMAPLAAGRKPAWVCPGCDQDIRVWLPEGAAIKTTIGVIPC